MLVHGRTRKLNFVKIEIQYFENIYGPTKGHFCQILKISVKIINHRNQTVLEPRKLHQKRWTRGYKSQKLAIFPFFKWKSAEIGKLGQKTQQGYPFMLSMSIKFCSVFRLTSQIEDDAAFNKQLSYTVVRFGARSGWWSETVYLQLFYLDRSGWIHKCTRVLYMSTFHQIKYTKLY